jgi:ubiquinone/menaquinone biosynthesis C-methylase UbiE/predicted transcriptional regulator
MLKLPLNQLVDVLRAVAQVSRLRILNLLKYSDLTVSDLTQILDQSQPRVSRHLKVLHEIGLISRYQEGAFAFFRVYDHAFSGQLSTQLVSHLDQNSDIITEDCVRLEKLKIERQARAEEYFSKNAHNWDQIRALHAPDAQVESHLLEIIGETPFNAMLDIGTGTGRILEILAPLYTQGIGIDINRNMLSIARANLEKSQIFHARVKYGDLRNLSLEPHHYDLVTLHQVLHFLENPLDAIQEAAKMLKTGGRLIIVDFSAHDLEILRQDHAHLKLGFSNEQIYDWFKESDLKPQKTLEISGNSFEKLSVKIWFAIR